MSSSASAQTEIKEIEKEMQKLKTLQKQLKKEIEKKKKILGQIIEERKRLEDFKKTIDKQIKDIQSKRYKKLAKDFENMDPEYAGEKLSKFKDPKIAAYILYNMKSKKAGEALNYVEPEQLNKIAKILTQLKNNEKSK